MKKNMLIALLIIVFVMLTSFGKKEARVFDPKDYRYHDGVAWVPIEKTYFFIFTETEEMVCIGEDGVEMFSIPDIMKSQVSAFCNGVAIVKGRYMIDKTGTVLHDLYDELNVEAVMFPNNYFDGFIFAVTKVNGVKMTGVLSSDLEWIVEPTSRLNDLEAKHNYLYFNRANGYYDVLENEFIDNDEYELRLLLRSFPESGLIFLSDEESFSGGSSRRFAYSSKGVKGKITLDNSCETGFYNQKLEMVLDLSCYPSVRALSYFHDDKCLIEFETEQGVTYTGLINLEGEFVFIYEGKYVSFNSKKIHFKDCYFDWEGNCFKE